MSGSYDIAFVWNLKNDTNELIYKTEINHRHGKQPYGYRRGKVGRDKSGVWN